ncbi:MAG: glucose-6-phosphate dehydrogenase, partial [Rhodothermales bacterium]
MPREFQPFVFVIVGASGDLTTRKLVPALYDLMTRHDELRACNLVGAARSEMTDEEFRAEIREALIEHGLSQVELSQWCDESVFYQSLGPRGDDYEHLASRIKEIEEAQGLPGNRVFYLALPPKVFPSAIEALGAAGLHKTRGWTRLVVEKPFGQDLDSARELNALVHRYFDESQVFRIDHYLG